MAESWTTKKIMMTSSVGSPMVVEAYEPENTIAVLTPFM